MGLQDTAGGMRGAMRGHLWAAACTCAMSIGCGATKTTLLAPPNVPTFSIDAAASELRSVNTNDATDLKPVAVDALQSMLTLRSGAAKPARFTAVVTASQDANAGGVVCDVLVTPLVFGFFGTFYLICPNDSWSADVDLTLDMEGTTRRGHGTASASEALIDEKYRKDQWTTLVHNAFQDAMTKMTVVAPK